MRISVLGLGNMGHSLAGRLLEHGHQVTVWNRSAGKAGDLLGRGALEASSPAEAVDGVEAVLLSVRDDDAAREVLTALAPRLGDGVPVANCTTSAPSATTALAALVPGYVAAPILGAPQAVADGSAAYVVAGPAAATGRLDEVWPALTGRVIPMGEDPAAASIVKVVSNHLLLTGLVAVTEAVAVAQAAGLADDVIKVMMSMLPTVPRALDNRLDDIVAGSHDGWFAMALGAKDLDLFVGLGTEHGLDPRLAGLARDRYLEAAAAGWDAADVAGVVELLRAPRA